MAVKPGDILRDKYRIDALIGRGGMGHVFAATALDSSNRTQVAIKVVSRLLVDDVLMVRLHREAEAAQRIQSDYVPRVLEVSDTEDGETFLVMERLVGEPLSQRIRDNGALPWSEVARIGQDVLRGLIDAHTGGIVHRDLKPSNVFLALKNGRVRAMVLDFGVCKMDGLDTERLTGTGESIGTVAYMAPEQIRGAARVDERADLFAFGVLVFEMLSGRLPHDGPSQMAILASKLENPAARLRDCTRVTIPQALDELVARALERDPEGRFASAQDLMKAWRQIVQQTDSMMPPTSSQPIRESASEDDVTAGGDAPTQISRPGSSNDMADTDEDLVEHARRSGAAFQRPGAPGTPGTPGTPGMPGVTINKRGAFAADTVREERDLSDFLPTPPASQAPPPSFIPGRSSPSIPVEPHPTQTALITQAGSSRRAGGGARIALLLAACGLVAGVVIVGVSFTRDPSGAPTNGSSPTAASAGGATDPAITTTSTSTSTTALALPLTEVPSGAVEIAPPSPNATDEASFELPADPAQPSVPGAKPRPRVRSVGTHHTTTAPTAAPKTNTSGPRITSQPRY